MALTIEDTYWGSQDLHEGERGDVRDTAGEDAVGMYLQEIGPIPLLTAAEEVELAKRIEAGRLAAERLEGDLNAEERSLALLERDSGEAARRKMIECNLRLVVSIARRYGGRGLPLADLIAEGNLGLMRATEKFDYHKGFRFSTYATWWIRQSVSRGIMGQSRVVRLPVHVSDMLNQVSKASIKLQQELSREPTLSELAEETGLTVEWVRDVLEASQQPLSLEQPLGTAADGMLGELIEDRSAEQPSESATRGLLREQLGVILHNLAARERQVINLRYGLDGGEHRTLEDVGKLLGLTRERIRQIEKEALRKLQQPELSGPLRAFVG